MTLTPHDVKPYSVWRHTKGGLYVVLGIATCSTNGEREGTERSVVYWSATYQALRYREVNEFLDGRFTPVTPVTLDREGRLTVPEKPAEGTP